MIKLEELNLHDYPTTPEILHNLEDLLIKINLVRTAYGIPMTVTSGLRSDAQQQQLIAQGKSNAPKSHHLEGKAVDILDTDGALNQWCKDNTSVLESAGLWCEVRQGGWQHFQTVPPKSGNRFFNP